MWAVQFDSLTVSLAKLVEKQNVPFDVTGRELLPQKPFADLFLRNRTGRELLFTKYYQTADRQTYRRHVDVLSRESSMTSKAGAAYIHVETDGGEDRKKG